jgi:hypothetical protein
VNSGLTNLFVQSLAISGTNLFAGTSGGGGIFLSSNNGISWTAVDSGLTNLYVQSLAVSGANLFAGTVGGGVFLSTNNGTSWTSVGLTDSYVFSLAVSGANLFAGTYGGGVFLSTNNGSSWIAVGFTDSYIYSLAVSGINLFAGTNGGVWLRPLSEMTTSVETLSPDLPGSFLLRQNYPNPFNPSTTINFKIPVSVYVSLKVFDMLGREVATLVSEKMVSGKYARRWNAENIPSGVYFYRLQAGSYVETKKLILLK